MSQHLCHEIDKKIRILNAERNKLETANGELRGKTIMSETYNPEYLK